MTMFNGKMISELRHAMKLSARDFGTLLNVTGNTVFRWEGEQRFPSRRHQKILNDLANKYLPRKLVSA
jgi:DNA-binding transcriptional regulator YiaG